MRLFLKISFLILCIFFSLYGYAQERHFFSRTLGVDIIPILSFASGGQSSYNEIELTFTEKVDQKLLRFKVNINNRNIYGDKYFHSILIDSSEVSGYIYQVNQYESAENILLSFGFSKIVPNNDLFIYYGLDFNIGINRGYVNTFKVAKKLLFDKEELVKSKKETIILAGATPILGVKIPISKRIYFGIEFGITLNYLFDDISYLNGDMEYQKAKFSRFDFNPIKAINDITLGVNF